MHRLDLLAAQDPSDVVFRGEHGTFDRAEVEQRVSTWQHRWSGRPKQLIAIDAPRADPDALCAYVAALRDGHCVLFRDGLDAGAADGPGADLAETFGVDLVVAGGELVDARPADRSALHPELAVLLPTSGSTGRRKGVRLSYGNLASNADAIAASTRVTRADRVITSLPLDFAFGMSLVNSHLRAGAQVVVSAQLPSGPALWGELFDHRATTVGLVPSTCALLQRQGWDPSATPSLRSVLVAGGATPAATLLELDARLRATDAVLFSMYGQAEATARITCLPPELLASRPASVGHAVPGTTVSVDAPAGEVGEVVVTGPGVMLGYARSRADLALGDVQGPTLRTGDLGRMSGGLLDIVGRADRQVKVLGRKVDLDAVEAAARDADGLPGGPVAAVLRGESVVVAYERTADHDRSQFGPARAGIARAVGLPPGCLRLQAVAAIPRTPSGKIAYAELARLLED